MTSEHYLRDSATALSALADRLDGAPLRGLLDAAGDATWRGDVADELRATITTLDGQLQDAIAELRATAAHRIWEADQIAAAEARRRLLEAQRRAAQEASRISTSNSKATFRGGIG